MREMLDPMLNEGLPLLDFSLVILVRLGFFELTDVKKRRNCCTSKSDQRSNKNQSCRQVNLQKYKL